MKHIINYNFEIKLVSYGFSILIEFGLGDVGFYGGKKIGGPEKKKTLGARRESIANSTHICGTGLKSILGHNGGRPR